MITLSENAANQLKKAMDEQGFYPEDDYLRVGLKAGGCSGYTYTVEFTTEKDKRDVEYFSEGIKIITDKKSNLFIKDTEIDWAFDLMHSGIVFTNKDAKASCGCGTSFQFEKPSEMKFEEIFKPTW